MAFTARLGANMARLGNVRLAAGDRPAPVIVTSSSYEPDHISLDRYKLKITRA
jgi:hypothetical protein